MVFPHQLYEHHPAFQKGREIIIIEDRQFFQGPDGQMTFHKLKIMLHRATMQLYRDSLLEKGYDVSYLEFHQDFPGELEQKGISRIYVADPSDNMLFRRISAAAKKLQAELKILETPGFLAPIPWIRDFFSGAAHFSQTRFYIAMRRRLEILIEEDGRPHGGKWSFDVLNRKRLPGDIQLPDIPRFEFETNRYIAQSRQYVEQNFPDHPGSTETFFYPISHPQAAAWLDHFLEHRLANFGRYQDAIVRDNSNLFHSLLSPLLNIGLLDPGQVVSESMRHSRNREIPLNSLEGFLRQIIGWREFMRAVYVLEGEKERKSNFWGQHRPMPASFYRGSTGIEPVDRSISRLLDTAYLNHIERLMILGNFMLLCEIKPDDVYRWFMEMFIDSYDWVMVPNIYGMSQHADGGRITTKPYISSSSYILRMSNYKKGPWCAIWDGLYWRFLFRHRDILAENPRMRLAISHLDRMDNRLLKKHLAVAENFLHALS